MQMEYMLVKGDKYFRTQVNTHSIPLLFGETPTFFTYVCTSWKQFVLLIYLFQLMKLSDDVSGQANTLVQQYLCQVLSEEMQIVFQIQKIFVIIVIY